MSACRPLAQVAPVPVIAEFDPNANIHTDINLHS